MEGTPNSDEAPAPKKNPILLPSIVTIFACLSNMNTFDIPIRYLIIEMNSNFKT